MRLVRSRDLHPKDVITECLCIGAETHGNFRGVNQRRELVNIHSWCFEAGEFPFLFVWPRCAWYDLHSRTFRQASTKDELCCKPGAEIVFGRKAISRDSFKYRAFPRGLVATN